MTPLELLAPARDLACGIAAIDHGADAVYIGARRYGARAAAGNSAEDIAALCGYAHAFGARVYVTLNTLVREDELDDVRDVVRDTTAAGVDAFLVRSAAVADIVRDVRGDNALPRLHASTQTDNRTAERVRALWAAGCGRIVLARELSIDEIAAIHAAVPEAELEVFVHGALCVSYSGVCRASERCFGRSADRGACAQFCRLRFDLIDADGRAVVRGKHLLSLKDMNRSALIDRLVLAGATSLKIEGRLKDEIYVKNVTAAYSDRIDEFIRRHPDDYCRAAYGHRRNTFTPALDKTFNRGYTTYFAEGTRADIASADTPKARGEYVGRVREATRHSITVDSPCSFAPGDGLTFFAPTGELVGFRVNSVRDGRLFPLSLPARLAAGTALYRNVDAAFEREVRASKGGRRIPVTMGMAPTDDGFVLTASCGGLTHEQLISWPHVQARAPQRELVARTLAKTGGTVFECAGTVIPPDFNFFIPASTLADARRKATDALAAQIARKTAGGVTRERHNAGGSATDAGGRQGDGAPHTRRHSNARDVEEAAPADGPLMVCRHCIKYTLGYCERLGGRRMPFREPLRLAMADGRTFRLQFCCGRGEGNGYAQCGMNVWET